MPKTCKECGETFEPQDHYYSVNDLRRVNLGLHGSLMTELCRYCLQELIDLSEALLGKEKPYQTPHHGAWE